MKTRTMFLTLLFCLATVAFALATDPNMGSWKLNEAKSKIPAGAPKNTSVVYTEAGDSAKCVVDGVDATGKPTHNEWTGKFDGKDYPLVGDSGADTRAIAMTSPRHYKLTNKKDGKPTTSGTITISADGKTRTVTTHSMHNGKAMNVSFVYDKQ